MKKLIAILMAFLMLTALASCDNGSEKPDVSGEIVTDNSGEAVTNSEGETMTEAVSADATNTESTEISTEASTVEDISVPSTDPSTWSAEEIVDFYKNAAAKSKTKVTSKQTMSMTEMVVNDGDGVLGFFIKLAKPLMISALERNSTEFEGITGGYENLVVSDAQSIKAYKSGEYTVVEMRMKEQTDGIYADTYSGTVGHAISVVGNISVVADEFPDFDIKFEQADIKLHYTNPKLKVKINKDGIIEKGTWSYTVDVTVKNLEIETIMIESAYGSVDYIITTGGGF